RSSPLLTTRWSSFFFFSSRRRHTSFSRDWSSDVCSSDLLAVHFRTPPVLFDSYLPKLFEALSLPVPSSLATASADPAPPVPTERSEERRVGREGGHRGAAADETKNATPRSSGRETRRECA